MAGYIRRIHVCVYAERAVSFRGLYLVPRSIEQMHTCRRILLRNINVISIVFGGLDLSSRSSNVVATRMWALLPTVHSA